MLANLIRVQMALELCLYAGAGFWLHSARGWGIPEAAAALLVTALGVRLAIVLVSLALSWACRSPRPPERQLGLAGSVRLALGEWRAMLADNLYWLPFEGVAVRADGPPAPAQGIPVLLVHGYFSNRGMMAPVVRALDAAGVRPVLTFNFSNPFATVETLVPELEAQVARALRDSGQPRIVLVCHSLGGLIARSWIAERGTARVAKIVTIASPHHGTALAALGVGANTAQMRPGSAFLIDLGRREGEAGPGIPVTSIYSLHDNLVAPQDTSRLAFAKNVELAGFGHVDLLHSTELHRLLHEELREVGVRIG